MARAKAAPITSIPENPDRELHSRMIKYGITMGIRVVCVILCLFVHGWWLVIPVLGAIVLPYFAVVIANAKGAGNAAEVERPGGLVPLAQSPRGDGR